VKDIRIEKVESVRSPWFHASFALYRRVFPKDEQMPKRYFYEHLVEEKLGLSRPFHFHYFVGIKGDRVLGFGCCTYLALVNMGFIDYLAVDSGAKGQGVGTALRAQLVEVLREDARRSRFSDLVAVLGETREESPWLRRLQRQGAFALDIDYLQPPLEDHKSPVPLVLYVQPVEKPFDGLGAEEVRQVLYTIYRRLYRIPYPLQDPNFRYMLKQINGRERIGGKLVEAACIPEAS
jgi:GNAT superfamily N-acetyltransferase